MSAISVLDNILDLLATDSKTKSYFVREGLEGGVTEAMIQQGLVEVTFDPSGVQSDLDYQGAGCVVCRLQYIIRITGRSGDFNIARRNVVRMALDVMNALQTTGENAGSAMVRIQSPIFGPLQLSTARIQELPSDCNAVSGFLTFSCVEYQVPGAR